MASEGSTLLLMLTTLMMMMMMMDDNDNDLDNNEDVGDNFEGCLEQVDVTRDLEVDR